MNTYKYEIVQEARALEELIKSPQWSRSLGKFLKAEKQRIQREFFDSLNSDNIQKQAKLSGSIQCLQLISEYISGTIERANIIESNNK